MVQPNFAVIGCEHAHIVSFISEMYELGCSCLGIYEPNNTELTRVVSDRFGIPVFSNVEQLMSQPFQIVGCAAINKDKIDIIELCEQHEKHIMLDKPIVTNRTDYFRLEAVIARGKIQVGMLLTDRFRPATYTLKRHIDAGVLGDILHISMRKPHRLSVDTRPSWFFDKEKCGGIVVDLMVHDFDLLRWFTGKEIVRMDGAVSKRILAHHPTFYDVASYLVTLDDAIIAQLYVDWHTPDASWTWGDGRIFIVGTKGCAELRLAGDPLSGTEGELMLQVTETGFQKVDLQTNPSTITEDFLSRVSGGQSTLTHKDILTTSRLTIEADEQAVVAVNI